jgi:hypothetical protein
MFEQLRRTFQRFMAPPAPDERDIAPQMFPVRPPRITMGSIVLYTLIKTGVMILGSWFAVEYFRLPEYWYLALFAVWLFAVYPAFLQYQKFQEDAEKIKKDSLCASCKHYDSTGIICTIYDEHVTPHHIPCEGNDWESKQFDM